MKDLITLADIKALRIELDGKGLIDSEGNPHLQVIKTPTIRAGDKAISLVRCLTQEDENLIYSLESITVLGECIEGMYVFYANNRDTYEKLVGVGEYYVPEHFTDEEGNQIEINKPYMFGLFA